MSSTPDVITILAGLALYGLAALLFGFVMAAFVRALPEGYRETLAELEERWF